MNVRYIQTAVTQENYDRIARGAFDEKLTLSDFVEKAVLFYLDERRNKVGQEIRIKKQE